MGGNYFILRFDLVFYELGGADMTKICIFQNLTFL